MRNLSQINENNISDQPNCNMAKISFQIKLFYYYYVVRSSGPARMAERMLVVIIYELLSD